LAAPTAVWCCVGSNVTIGHTRGLSPLVYPVDQTAPLRALGVGVWLATALAWAWALGLSWSGVAVQACWAAAGAAWLRYGTQPFVGLVRWHPALGWQSVQAAQRQNLSDVRLLWDGQRVLLLTWCDARGAVQLAWLSQARCPKRWLRLRQRIQWWLRHA
jgi:hypothetical protein